MADEMSIRRGRRVRVNGTHFHNHGRIGTVESVDADGMTNDHGELVPQYAHVFIDGGGEGAWVYPVTALEVVR